jgi:hypothetical protein
LLLERDLDEKDDQLEAIVAGQEAAKKELKAIKTAVVMFVVEFTSALAFYVVTRIN